MIINGVSQKRMTILVNRENASTTTTKVKMIRWEHFRDSIIIGSAELTISPNGNNMIEVRIIGDNGVVVSIMGIVL